MGAAFAAVAGVPCPSDRLPVIDSAEFCRAHVARIDELGGRLQPFVREISDWTELSHRGLPISTPLVLTHGDPGPGNYLDSDASGTLIDWEEAHVAPLGLDLGRLIFIALLGSGPQGYVARDHQSRASSAAAGYLGVVRPRWSPSGEELRWWVSVAAIQFIHRRWERGGRPAPWEHAAEVLAPTLAVSPQLARMT
jgi:aminoglycoside phosphotransferase (APT) family kinase protein